MKSTEDGNVVAVLLTQDDLERLISALQTKHGEPPSQRDWSLKFADRLKRLREAFTKEGK
jgi:hypothetical protein